MNSHRLWRAAAGGDGHDDGDNEQADDVAAPVPVAAAHATEDGGKLGHDRQHGDGAGDGGDHGHNEGVAIAHVRHFVSHHAGQLFAGQDAADAGGYGDGGVLRVASGGEGVGRIGVDFVHLGHGHIGPLSLFVDQSKQFGVILGGNLLGVSHAERNPVAEPVGPEIQDQGENHSDDNAQLTAKIGSDEQQESGQHHQQEKCFEGVHNFLAQERWSIKPPLVALYHSEFRAKVKQI